MKHKLLVFLLAASGWLHHGFPARAGAENWPGWRKDGTGVSSEVGVPFRWGPETNIRWKTQIPGEGLSSPIVWQDQVIVTTARPASERHPLVPAALVVLSLFCATALWCSVDGTFDDPLGTTKVPWSVAPGRRNWLRKLLVSLLFLGVGYGTIMGVERAYDLFEKYPESLRNRLFDKTWYFTDVPGAEEIRTPLSAFRIFSGSSVPGPFFGSPRIPKACYYAGILAIFSVLVVNTAIARRQRSRQAQPPSTDQDTGPERRPFPLCVNLRGLAAGFGLWSVRPLITALSRLLDGLALVAVACFLITVHSAAMADLPYAPSGNTWFLAGSIGTLGLIAFNLWLPARGWLRVGGVLVTCAALAYVVLAAPENEAFGIRATAVRAGFPRLVKLLAGLCVVGIAAALLRAIPSGPAGSARRPWLGRCLGPVAVLLAGGVYFVSSNFLLPRHAHAREVVSVDRGTGAIRWVAPCHSGDISREMHAANTMATATPVTDGKHIYAHFSDAGLFCLDMTGHVQWRYDEPVPPSHWGAASSPILWQDLVIMTYDTDHHSLTVGVDKTTGTERWRSDRTNRIVASQLLDGYATPMIVQRNGKAELVHQACKLLVGYEPASGTERWAFSHPGEQPVPSPVVSDDLVIVLGGKYAPYLGAVRVDSEGDREVATEVWSGSKGLSDLSSPVVYGGYVYMVNKMGIACCLDAKSGRYQWQRRLKGAFWSSVTAADGKVYFSNATGTTTVIAAGPDYKVLSVNKLGEDVRTSLAVSGGAIFVRTQEHLIRIGPEDSHAARHEPRE